jgi:hypothetical protein
MTSHRRRWFVVFSAVAIVLGLAIAFFLPSKPATSESLLLPDGTALRIVDVTYGTNHLFGTPLGRLVAKLPPRIGRVAKDLLGARVAIQQTYGSATPSLIVWLERTTNTPTAQILGGYVSAMLADETGFVSGEEVNLWGTGMRIVRLVFPVVPRRDPNLRVEVTYRGRTGGTDPVGSLSFENPVYGRYPHWTPETLPATKRVGELEVTLNKLSAGHGDSTSHRSGPGNTRVIDFGTNSSTSRGRCVCLLSVRSVSDSNGIWRVASVRVSDATGNSVKSTSMGWGGDDEPFFTFRPGLWPGESAWKLACEIKRSKGHGPAELITFRNVPLGQLGATNRIGWTTNFQGVAITLDHLVRKPPLTNDSWSSSEISGVRLTHSTLATNTHLDFVRLVADTGETVRSESSSSSDAERTYSFRELPLEAKTADITFAVHRSHRVEFVVKPEIRTARLELPAPRVK